MTDINVSVEDITVAVSAVERIDVVVSSVEPINIVVGMDNINVVVNPNEIIDVSFANVLVEGGEIIYQRLVDDTSALNTVYVGESAFGSEEDEPVWRIYKAVFDGVDVTKTWAGGAALFLYKWSERLILIYS